MKGIEIHYEGENLHITIPDGMTDEHGNFIPEYVEEALQDWGIIEINEINPDRDTKGLWVDSGNKNIYVWDWEVTYKLKRIQEAVFVPQGKLSQYINLNNPQHREFIVWYYGEPLEDAIKQMEEDCK